METGTKTIGTKKGKLTEFFETRGWCQGHYALNADGEQTKAISGEAVAWCLLGGIDAVRATPKERGWLKVAIHNEISKSIYGGRNVIEWNDKKGRTKDEIMALLANAGV